MKTLKLTFVVAIIAVVGIVGFIGCGGGGDDAPPKVAVTGVTLDKSEITLLEGNTYTLKATVEPKKATNKKVSWKSDNEAVATVNSTGKVTAVAKGTATITVTTKDKGKTAECTVTVKPLPVSIEVTKSPTKIKMGEQLDLDDIEVTATFSDDSENEVEITLADISGFNPTTAGKQTVTVTYAELSDTFDVWVLALSKIEVTYSEELEHEHVIIAVGENVDLEDIVVTATWQNESDNEHIITEPVTITLENLSAFDRTKASTETVTVTVTYNGKTDTFDVLVLGVTSIAVTKQPDKTTYKIGEQLDLTGLELTVTFSDGEEETVHGSALANDVTGFNSTTAGEKTVTVTYGGQTDTFTVKIVSVVTFNPNGGNWDSDTGNKTVEVELNETVVKPDDPTNNSPLAQNHLRGWYTDNGTFANAFSFDTPITDNIELFAEWGYRLSDTGPGGGKIFYRSESGFTMTDDNSTAHYLEAAPADTATRSRWVAESYGSGISSYSSYPNITNTAIEIGTGMKNTTLILAADVDAPAAKACNEYANNGKTDWFLPSKNELNELYQQSALFNNLQMDSAYWSSSQSTSGQACLQWFINGNQIEEWKDDVYYIRPIRAF